MHSRIALKSPSPRVALAVKSASLAVLFCTALICSAYSYRACDIITSIDREIQIAEWHYIGPFSVGPREGILGITDDPGQLRPDETPHATALVQGGFVTWKQARPDSTGWVTVEFEGVPWDTLMDIYGYAGIVNGAYAYGEFDSPSPGRALIIAERVGSFHLNGRLHYGDSYGHGYTRIPVILERGVNRVILKLTGYGDHRFRFGLEPAPAPVITLRDYTVPDIIEGETGRFWVGVPLVNTTDRSLHNVTLSVGDNRHAAQKAIDVSAPAALCVKKVPIEIEILPTTWPGATGGEDPGISDGGRDAQSGGTAAEPAFDDEMLPVPLEVTHDGHTYRDTIHLRVRTGGQSFKRTFISAIDRSCQYYAVLPPAGYDPDKRYSLILTLHGANVRADGQADAYKPKTWAFVVAPTNRRRYGFDWQDWGRLDAMEVLEIAKSTLPVDTCRVYLTGHSMGGHGAWHVGLTHPDRFAAMAPAAGWVSFELYVPWFLQKAYIFGHPYQRATREVSLAQDWPLRFIENARNLPIFILQGGADDNVPPVHARMFTRRLDELGYEYRYKEDPGKGHWYNIDSLGVACVDDPDLIGFFTDRVIDAWPPDVVFATTNVAHSRRAYWVEITEQETPYLESRIEAHVFSETMEISTQNVRQFAISLSPRLAPSGRVEIAVDGNRWTMHVGDSRRIAFAKRAGTFRVGRHQRPGSKTPDLHGPVKQAYFSPFVLVYGTQDEQMTDLLHHQARLEAYQWWRRGNGLVDVLADSEVTPGIVTDYNLILFGGPEQNCITRRIDRHLPIRLVDGIFLLDGKPVAGTGLAAKFVYPNPLNNSRFVVVHEGQGRQGLELSTFFTTIYAGAGLPDFLIFSSSARRIGWGGVLAGGFFDSQWQVDRSLTIFGAGRTEDR